jgi:hypothetical protein
MTFSIWATIGSGMLLCGLFVYGLLKHEDRLEEMERKIVANQEKFTNK